jgi:hypothetical protein
MEADGQGVTRMTWRRSETALVCEEWDALTGRKHGRRESQHAIVENTE